MGFMVKFWLKLSSNYPSPLNSNFSIRIHWSQNWDRRKSFELSGVRINRVRINEDLLYIRISFFHLDLMLYFY